MAVPISAPQPVTFKTVARLSGPHAAMSPDYKFSWATSPRDIRIRTIHHGVKSQSPFQILCARLLSLRISTAAPLCVFRLQTYVAQAKEFSSTCKVKEHSMEPTKKNSLREVVKCELTSGMTLANFRATVSTTLSKEQHQAEFLEVGRQ